MGPKLIIIGASYLQLPLVLKARERGVETHVFAWEKDAVARYDCDHFYPVSITDRNRILEQARAIRPNGIASIASDLAMPTVNYIAEELGLLGNSVSSTELTTNKLKMRQRLSEAGLPCPAFTAIETAEAAADCGFAVPLIIKPTDRSGSRGVIKVSDPASIQVAAERALEHSLEGRAIIEEFIEGSEISVETMTWKGEHHVLAVTDKETTGAPYFVETGHHQPSRFDTETKARAIDVVCRALTCLDVRYGASHSELMITSKGDIYIVEIGARMGGDCIGSHLVELSTGYDYVGGVIDVALGTFSGIDRARQRYSGIRYLTAPSGRVEDIIDRTGDFPEIVAKALFVKKGDVVVAQTESSHRLGYYIYASDTCFMPSVAPMSLRTVPA